MTNRVTVSLTDQTKTILESIADSTDDSQSEVVRNALQFYEANLNIAEEGGTQELWKYNKVLASQDHILLDRDFMHLFLTTLDDYGELESFYESVSQVAEYHVPEYREDFETPMEMFDWLEFCGFLRYRKIAETQIQILFPDKFIKEMMSRFIVDVLEGLDVDVEMDRDGLTKIVLESPGFSQSWNAP